MARDRRDWDIGVTGGAHVPVLAISCPGSRAARAIAVCGSSARVIARTTTIRSAPAREPALDGAQVG